MSAAAPLSGAAPRLVQCLWFLSRPWPHLSGLRELLLRAAFRLPDGRVIEGCAASGVPGEVDAVALAARLDAAEAALQAGAAVHDPLAARLLALAERDARFRGGERGNAHAWPRRIRLLAPAEPPADAFVCLPGLSIQQALAEALEAGQVEVFAAGPWAAAARQLPETEATQMLRCHPDLYEVAAAGVRLAPDADGWLLAESLRRAFGFGYTQKIETHRRRGIGRLRGR